MIQVEKRPRIDRLREYYYTHSKMAIDKNTVFWKSHRSLLLYTEGWQKSFSAPTVRLRRAAAEAYLLSHTTPVILPGELIVGQPCFDEFTEAEAARYRECEAMQGILPPARGRADHLAMDYTLLLEKGVCGILALLQEELDKIDLCDGAQTERYEFLLCCQTELEGLLQLSDAYAQKAKALADAAVGQQKEEYLALYEVLSKVPARPAKTLREALQSIHTFTWSLYGIYSFGKPDLYLFPYYRRDIESGRLTPDDAQELIDCFFLQSVPNVPSWAAEGLMLGGRDGEGRSVENELTWHFLTAIAHTHLPDPNVGFCVTKETGEEILRYAASLITDGHCQPQIWNSDEVTRSLCAYGVDQRDAYLFTLSTCAEVTPIGCSGVSITSPYINLLQIFLNTFYKCDNASSFEDIFETFRLDFQAYAKQAILQENLWQLERGRNSTDPARISVLIHDCIQRGRTNDSGGARYNHLEPNILGMQNVTESLNVIKRLVFDEGRVTVEDLQRILKENYKNDPALLQQIRNKIPHFGTGDSETNALAKRVADMVLDTFAPMTTVRGAQVIPGAFSYREHELQGRVTPASPDGRTDGMPLNDGSCPVQGYDRLGPTLSLASTVAWEPSRFLGGTTVNVKLNAGVSIDKLVALIRGYLSTHGAQLQFNVVDTQTLLDAQAHPELHRDLLVRIGGYSDFFVTIPKSLQDEIISRSKHELS